MRKKDPRLIIIYSLAFFSQAALLCFNVVLLSVYLFLEHCPSCRLKTRSGTRDDRETSGFTKEKCVCTRYDQ